MGVRDREIRIGLVVAEKDVVARRQALDEVVLEEQRLAFRARCRNLDRGHLPDHHLRARTVRGLVEVRGDALLEVARLADVERLAALAEHAVNPRQIRQAFDEFLRVEHSDFIISV